jgi:hypothetical protein
VKSLRAASLGAVSCIVIACATAETTNDPETAIANNEVEAGVPAAQPGDADSTPSKDAGASMDAPLDHGANEIDASSSDARLGDATPSDGAPDVAAFDAPACVSFPYVDGSHMFSAVGLSAPGTNGGVIPDGLYEMTDEIMYTGPGGSSAPPQQVAGTVWIRVQGFTWDFSTTNGSADLAERVSVTNIGGLFLTLSHVCGDPIIGAQQSTVRYDVVSSASDAGADSAVNTNLELQWAQSSSIRSQAYLKQ